MKELTEHTRALLDRIIDRQCGVERTLPPTETLAVLEELGRSGAPAAIPYLLPFLVRQKPRGGIVRSIRGLFSKGRDALSDEVADAAGEAVGSLLARSRVGDLPGLDEAVRHVWGAYVITSWDGIESLSALPVVAEWPIAMFAAASFHRNGRVREQAVRELAQGRDGAELPFLLLRLNDWVEEVRRVAVQEVLIRAGSKYAQHFVACLPLVTRLDDLQRADHVRVSAAIYSLLLSPDALPALLGAISCDDRSVRRDALRHLTETHEVPWPEVFQKTSRDPDLPIRLWTAREASRRLPEQEAVDQLEALTLDPHLAVRVESLRGLMEISGSSVIEHLRAAVLDRAGSVREFARYYLKSLGVEDDFAPLYRRALVSGDRNTARVAACGLGETGTEGDVRLVEPFLESTSSRDVQAGLRAVARLSLAECRSTIMGYIGDHRAGVRRVAARLLTSTIAEGDFEALRATAVAEGPEESKLPAVWLARRVDVWSRIRLLLSFPATRGSVLAEAVEEAMGEWCYDYAHSPYAPRPAEAFEMEDVVRLLGRAERWASADVTRAIRDTLKK